MREAETGGENGVEKERTRETSASDAERREGAPWRGNPEERGETVRAPLPLTLSLPTKARVACPISHFSPTDTYTDTTAAAAANPVYPHARSRAPMCASANAFAIVGRAWYSRIRSDEKCSILSTRKEERDRMARAGLARLEGKA